MLKKDHISLGTFQRARIMEFASYCDKLAYGIHTGGRKDFLALARKNLEGKIKSLPVFCQSEIKEDMVAMEVLGFIAFGYKDLDSYEDRAVSKNAAIYYRSFTNLHDQVIFNTAVFSYAKETLNSDILDYFEEEYEDSPTWLRSAYKDYADCDTGASVFPELRGSLCSVLQAVHGRMEEGPDATRLKVIHHLLGYKPYQPEA